MDAFALAEGSQSGDIPALACKQPRKIDRSPRARESIPPSNQKQICKGLKGLGMHWIAYIVRYALVRWGYLALAVALMGEDAGLPLPGESVLMLASFLSHKSTGLRLPWLILVGIGAAIMGDNLGYFAGRWLGPRLLRWLRRKLHMDDDIVTATDLIRRHGPATVFWARYIPGLRAIAGPVAGALGMEWRRFLLFNALGAITWVTAMALTGYAFANEFDSLLSYFAKASWVISGSIFGIGYFLWRRRKKRIRRQMEKAQSQKAA